MSNTWLTDDHRIDLPALFRYMGYDLVKETEKYELFLKRKKYYVVVYTEKGYRYYHVGRPQLKLGASHLVREHLSKVEGVDNESIWGKVNGYYLEVLENKELILGENESVSLENVAMTYNHFDDYKNVSFKSSSAFYKDACTSEKFKGAIHFSEKGNPLFPLRNFQNEVCGFFVDDNGVGPLGESAIGNSLWYSNIPDSIDWLLIFKDPLEALAFDKKFQLENVVYLALSEINYQTTKILFEIKRLTKVKKLVMTFSGTKKIEGYLRDLHFISFINDANFQMSLGEKDIAIRFQMQDEKSFLGFFNKIKKFNQGLSSSYLKYNAVLDQNLINQYSILISKDVDGIKVRVPLEVNAIKYFVWCYFKNYLSKSLDILKPKYPNWYMEWEATQSIQLKGKEEALKTYRIAL